MTDDRELTLTGRYFQMHPPDAFAGLTEERLTLPMRETAVLAVDIYGAHDRPDVWSGLVTKSSTQQAGQLLHERIAPVLEATRLVGLPLIFVANSAPRIALEHSAYGELKDRGMHVDQNELYAEADADGLEYQRGPSEVLTYTDDVAPREGDYFIRKHVHSAFFDTRLDTLLRNLGIRNLVCLGFTLDVCLGTTMMDAVWRNYRVVLLRDCTYAIELPGIDHDGSWTKRWITYVECNVGHSTTSQEFLEACRVLSA